MYVKAGLIDLPSSYSEAILMLLHRTKAEHSETCLANQLTVTLLWEYK